MTNSPYRFVSLSDQVTWRYVWYWKFLHLRTYWRMRNAFKGIPSLSGLLEADGTEE